MLYSFGPFELDLATCELRREGRGLPLQPRVFGVMRYLIEHRDRVVGKQELIDALWGGTQLNAVAVPWTINRARKALDDERNGTSFIETVRGHGYRFTADVQVRGADVLANNEAVQPLAVQSQLKRPFVGRVVIMQQLSAALDAAVEGCGSLCLLSGEAGIGKTRCVDEFALIARRQGLQVWLGRCFQHGSAPAFWPFIQVLRAACADAALNERLRSEGLALLKEIEPRPPDLQHSTQQPSRPDGERFWLLDRLSSWLCRSAQSRVRVIELEDIHCADESSLQVLSLLAPLLREARVLVVATARSVGAGQLRSAATLAARIRPCEQVEIVGLGSEDSAIYLRALLGERLAAQVSRPLAEKTAGNPLFLHELARVVSACYARDGAVRLDELPLPAAVTEIISGRLRELDSSTRALLDAACVVGDEFGVTVLQRASGQGAEQVLAGLQLATLVDILERRRDGLTHAFVHPLMREVLYGALSTTQRAHLHAAVGHALEALGVAEPSLNELAYHFHHAPLEACYPRAMRYGRLAGDAAMRALAYDEAVQCYAWALEAQTQLAPDDIPGACDLLLISASALALAGRHAEARRYCQRAMELARDAKLPEILVRASRQRRPSVWLAHTPDPAATKALELALQLLPENASRARARAYSHLAVFPPYSLNIEASQRMSAEAVRLASELNDPQLMLEVQAARLFGLCGPESTAEQLAVANHVLQHDPRQNVHAAVDAHFARYHTLMVRGEGRGAEQALDAYARLASELRLPFSSWHCERLRAQRMIDGGNLNAAEHRFAELWVQSERMQLPLAGRYKLAVCRALNLERTGKHRLGPVAVEVAPWIQALPSYRARQILLAIEDGEHALASHALRELADDDFAAQTRDVFGLASLVQLVGAAVTLGDRQAALGLWARLAPHAQLSAITVFTNSLGSVSRYLGELEQFLGRPVEAQRSFERAIENNARSGHELERLRSTLALARLFARGRASERAQARKLASATADAAQSFGAHALVAAARGLSSGVLAARSTPQTGGKVERSSRPARGRV